MVARLRFSTYLAMLISVSVTTVWAAKVQAQSDRLEVLEKSTQQDVLVSPTTQKRKSGETRKLSSQENSILSGSQSNSVGELSVTSRNEVQGDIEARQESKVSIGNTQIGGQTEGSVTGPKGGAVTGPIGGGVSGPVGIGVTRSKGGNVNESKTDEDRDLRTGNGRGSKWDLKKSFKWRWFGWIKPVLVKAGQKFGSALYKDGLINGYHHLLNSKNFLISLDTEALGFLVKNMADMIDGILLLKAFVDETNEHMDFGLDETVDALKNAPDLVTFAGENPEELTKALALTTAVTVNVAIEKATFGLLESDFSPDHILEIADEIGGPIGAIIYDNILSQRS